MQRGADVALRGMDVCPIPDLLAGISNHIEALASLRLFTDTSRQIGLCGEAEANVSDRPSSHRAEPKGAPQSGRSPEGIGSTALSWEEHVPGASADSAILIEERFL